MAQTQKCMGRATRIVRTQRFPSGEVVAALYHDTCVAWRDGKVVKLNSGGYRTATTKLRMNQFANEFCNGGFKVYQKGGEWFVHIAPIGLVYPFYDGMEFEV